MRVHPTHAITREEAGFDPPAREVHEPWRPPNRCIVCEDPFEPDPDHRRVCERCQLICKAEVAIAKASGQIVDLRGVDCLK